MRIFLFICHCANRQCADLFDSIDTNQNETYELKIVRPCIQRSQVQQTRRHKQGQTEILIGVLKFEISKFR